MRFTAVYRIRCKSEDIARKAEALSIEQSVEMPIDAIDDRFVLDEIVGRVDGIEDAGDGSFLVRIGLASATAGGEPGQLLNMAFGNSSLHDDVTLEDLELPDDILSAFGGPGGGLEGLRDRSSAHGRPLTCSAIKPQGLQPPALADLVYRFALGSIDFVKDDHGIADQSYSRFADRVAACAEAARKASALTGKATGYVPNLSGHLGVLREQIEIARGEGVNTVLIAPMIVGLPAFHALVQENRDMAFLAHPAMAGAARIAPTLLLGKLFRLFGADAVIYPHHGGRFGYSAAVCHGIARQARASWGSLPPSMPVPAGGMTLDRLGEILDFYGPDVMILIGGGLLSARERLTQESARFVRRVASLEGQRKS